MTEKMVLAYLSRIGLDRSVLDEKRDKKLIDKLQYAHVTSVPYENIDIVKEIPLRLDTDALFEKIVERRRGGFCFELNALYNDLLKSIGFETVSCFARYLRGICGIPMRRHRVTIAGSSDTSDRIFTDVGIGERAPRYSLLLEEDIIQEQFSETYRFRKEDFWGWALWEKHNGEWGRFMSFTEEPQVEEDYAATSFYCEKSPESVFRGEMKLAIKTENGRMTVAGDLFRIFDGDSVLETKIVNEKEREEILSKYFGIRL